MKGMNYFPYIALGLVAVIGYFHINALLSSVKELESKNAALRAEVRQAKQVIESVNNQYMEINRNLRLYNGNFTAMQTTVNSISTKLQRDEKRLEYIAKAHPQLIEKVVNQAVEKRLACIIAAAQGKPNAQVNNKQVNCVVPNGNNPQ